MSNESESKDFLLSVCHQVINYTNTKGITAAEVFFHLKKNIQVLIEGQSISTGRSTSELGIGIRVINKDVEGFSYTNKTDNGALMSCVNQAVNITRVAPPTKGIKLPVPTEYPHIDGRYTSSVANLTTEDLIDNAKMILRPMKEAKATVRNNLSRIEVQEEVYGIVNTNGIEAYSKSNQLGGFFVSAAREGEKVGSFVFEDFFTHEVSKIDFTEFGENLTSRCIRNLEAITPSSIDSDTVVFSKGGVFDPLMYVIAHSIRADSVDQERSLWKDRLADTVAVDNFSLVDDAHNPNTGGGCRSFDDEGNSTQKLPIITDGVLETFLFDELRANKMGTDSTGNSWRGLGGVKFSLHPTWRFGYRRII